MSKTRLEAFSDGVLAIIITIMVLELKVPHGNTLKDIQPLLGIFLSYILSFIYVLIYWNNHHHLFQSVKHVNGKVLWANGHLLFWLSLFPFASGWMGENHFAPVPVLLYAIIALMSGFAYNILTETLSKIHEEDSVFKKANRSTRKGIASIVLYFLATILAYFVPMVSCGIFVVVAIMWLIPNRDIEKIIH
jgi:uncharacterized membrane protein